MKYTVKELELKPDLREAYRKALMTLSVDELIDLSVGYIHNVCVLTRCIVGDFEPHMFGYVNVHEENLNEFITDLMDQLHNLPSSIANKSKESIVYELSRIAVFLEEDKYNISKHHPLVKTNNKLKAIVESHN
ncbi:hypothetical protein [Bacillus pseudomycoides]|uniref:hypothetical protein n=1 Tax=Bacillus pseudomycoides TaxID=64104 RepID=UPI000BEBFBF4|nr:hypothetical protein [Bacillus pseudomycoides]PEB42227.1 hypothetical protein COO06_07905 [Bacillus pseudomycoides]